MGRNERMNRNLRLARPMAGLNSAVESLGSEKVAHEADSSVVVVTVVPVSGLDLTLKSPGKNTNTFSHGG